MQKSLNDVSTCPAIKNASYIDIGICSVLCVRSFQCIKKNAGWIQTDGREERKKEAVLKIIYWSLCTRKGKKKNEVENQT